MGAEGQGADATQGRWLCIPRTLIFVTNGDSVLLMKRAAHKRVFPNQYNGLGGHIERGEDPAAAALREVHEESGLRVHSLRLRGIHHIDAGASAGIILFVYTAISDARAFASDTDEGALHWIPRDKLGELDLVEDLPTLLPQVLDMKDDESPYSAHVSYDAADNIVIRMRDA